MTYTATTPPVIYGWAVMAWVGLGAQGHDELASKGMKGDIVIIPVKAERWKEAKTSWPYQYLNTHPKQPASIEDTKALAEETWKKMKRDTLNTYDWDRT